LWKKAIEICGDNLYLKAVEQIPSFWKEACLKCKIYTEANHFLEIGISTCIDKIEILLTQAKIEEKFNNF
jgi:hypothetical protein